MFKKKTGVAPWYVAATPNGHIQLTHKYCRFVSLIFFPFLNSLGLRTKIFLSSRIWFMIERCPGNGVIKSLNSTLWYNVFLIIISVILLFILHISMIRAREIDSILADGGSKISDHHWDRTMQQWSMALLRGTYWDCLASAWQRSHFRLVFCGKVVLPWSSRPVCVEISVAILP